MAKKIYQVTNLQRIISVAKPHKLIIYAEGQASSSGWTNGALQPHIYVSPPADGVYEFDFVADEPTGIDNPVLTPIDALFVWDKMPDHLEGVKVYAENNDMSVRR